VSWSCSKPFAVGFGQSLERALILIGGARIIPGLQWKLACSSSSGALVVYWARTVLMASSKARACNSSLVRCILSSKLTGCPADGV
jgi:hypothetical protein